MATRVRVASRAVRRGRSLRARASEAPSARPPEDDEVALVDTTPESQPVDTPDTRRLTKPIPGASTDDAPEAPTARFSRPAAPNLDLFGGDDFGGDELEEDARADARADAEAAAAARSPEDALEPAAVASHPSVPVARASAFSRPPAPSLDFGAGDDDELGDEEHRAADELEGDDEVGDEEHRDELEEDELREPDPNATTLVSHAGPRPSRPTPSAVNVVDADEDDDFDDDDFDDDALEAASHDDEETRSESSFRQTEATLAPVVDEVAPSSSESLEAALLSPAEAQRRRSLRRGVGVGLVAAALLVAGLVTKSALQNNATSAGGKQEAAPLAREGATEGSAPTEAAKPAEGQEAAAPEAGAEPVADITSSLPDDLDDLEKKTVELLTERKFDEAIVFAKKLIEKKPDSAFGYRCLGSALQDLGRYNEAQQVYSDCATHATKGEVIECTALGGRDRKVLGAN